MEDKKPTGPGGDNSSAAETIVDVSHKLKNPILTEADLRRLASTFATRSFANRRFNSGIVKFSRVYALNKP
ncbi:hypothetical protein FACS1894218_3670 [Bacilli bacterium]|nr:hypothetical protein FACS1894218_3670 [Bacilli bacterium]